MKINPSKSLILLAVICMDLLTGMEFDLFVPGFPQLQHQFNLSAFWVEALLSINFIGYCLSLFFIGLLADRYGRKPIISLGLALFVMGSVLCLYPKVYTFLLIGRLLQGIGIAAPAILSFLIIADLYALKEQQFLMAILNGLINIAIGIAPVIGSYITLYFNWEGNFVALLLLSVFTLLMTLFFIPAYTLPLNPDLEANGYLSIFRSRPLMLLIVNIIFIFAPYWIFVGISPLLFIKDLGISLAHFGYYQGVLAVVFAIGSLLYGVLMKHIDFDSKSMLSLSFKFLVISLIILISITFLNSKNPLIITLAFLPFVISQIIPSIILYPLALNFLPHAKAKASALIQGSRLILTSMGLQVIGYFYQGTFQNLGIVLSSFILGAGITLYFVIHERKLMQQLQ